MIATISPTAAAIKHTRNTLHYAGTASTITLAPPKTVEDDAEVRRLPGNYLIASLMTSLMTCLNASLMTSPSATLRSTLIRCGMRSCTRRTRNSFSSSNSAHQTFRSCR